MLLRCASVDHVCRCYVATAAAACTRVVLLARAQVTGTALLVLTQGLVLAATHLPCSGSSCMLDAPQRPSRLGPCLMMCWRTVCSWRW